MELSSRHLQNIKFPTIQEGDPRTKRLSTVDPVYTIICMSNIAYRNCNIAYFILGQVKKKTCFVVRISIKKRAGGRFFFLLFIISYCMLSFHIITFPEELLGQILVKRNIRY